MEVRVPEYSLAEADQLTEAELDVLPFGLIQLDRTGRILKFNAAESRLARFEQADALGRNFFDDVAPCTKVKEFYGRFQEGVEKRELNARIPYRFNFRDGRRKDVMVTLFYSRKTETVWLQVVRP